MKQRQSPSGRWPVKCIVIGLSALAVFAGASACSGRSTRAPAHTESALSQKSYKDGETVGEDNATHGTLAEDRANCADTATEQMPAGWSRLGFC
jgi:hypothetical protein